jgi:hypothetical protein
MPADAGPAVPRSRAALDEREDEAEALGCARIDLVYGRSAEYHE